MTNKEAIVHMEEIRPKKCKMVDGRLQGGFPDHDSDIGKAIDMAIEAIEKQIPKKVVTRTLYNECWQREYTIRVCPVCGVDTPVPRELESWEFWCPDCGQALDWSEERGE